MLTKSTLTVAALALAAGLGSASAAEQFTSLAGIAAEVMSSQSMGEVRGANHDPNMISLGSLTTTIGVMNQEIGGHTDTFLLGFIEAIEQITNLNEDPLTLFLFCRTC